MAYKLVKGEYKVKCGNPACNFEKTFLLESENILGIDEDSVDQASIELITYMANCEHLTMNYGEETDQESAEQEASCDCDMVQEHELCEPEVTKISAIYEFVELSDNNRVLKEAVKYHDYNKGEQVVAKEGVFHQICEVINGSVYVNKSKPTVYKTGDIFGRNALIVNQEQSFEIVAGEDNTTVAFYNLPELFDKDLKKCLELYHGAAYDVLSIIYDLNQRNTQQSEIVESAEIQRQNQMTKLAYLENFVTKK